MAPKTADTELKQRTQTSSWESVNGDAHSSKQQQLGDKLPSNVMSEEHPTDVPTEVPHIVAIKRALPHHCFEPSLFESFFYVLKDLSYISVLYMLLLVLERQPYHVLRYAYLPIYWFLQGTMMWAVFVLAHDCGHGSFSRHQFLNDTVGTLLNTLILVPFYPWKLSHKHHHRNTGNIDKDEIFYPVRLQHYQAGRDMNLLPYFGGGVSWWMYLIAGYSPRKNKHLNPWDPMFRNHSLGCALSLASLCGWLYAVYSYTRMFGILILVMHYVIPLLIFSSWLVIVTFLHHNDVKIPWYADEKWDNVRGQLSSVDRHYGWAHHLTHNIGTHQVHHLFIKIPHYRLEEATNAFRKAFPELVRVNNEPILHTFCKTFSIFNSQRLIGDNAKFHVYQK